MITARTWRQVAARLPLCLVNVYLLMLTYHSLVYASTINF